MDVQLLSKGRKAKETDKQQPKAPWNGPVVELQVAEFMQSQVSKAMTNALPASAFFEETLPAEVLKERNLMGMSEAIRKFHFPDSAESFHAARRRIAYQEFYDFIYGIRTMKEKEAQNWQREQLWVLVVRQIMMPR